MGYWPFSLEVSILFCKPLFLLLLQSSALEFLFPFLFVKPICGVVTGGSPTKTTG